MVNWGLNFIVPLKKLSFFSGKALSEEISDKELTKHELGGNGCSVIPFRDMDRRHFFKAVCKRQDVGIGSFVRCLEEYPQGCKFAVPLGTAYLCEAPVQSTSLRNLGNDNNFLRISKSGRP